MPVHVGLLFFLFFSESVSVSILSYNVAGLPPLPPVIPDNNNNDRIEAIIDLILEENYDFVCLQESFDLNITNALSDRLPEKYAHIFTNIAPGTYPQGYTVSSGLTLATNHTVIATAFEEFTQKTDSDALARKGVFGAIVNMTGGLAFVATTHTQASYSGPTQYIDIRISQMQQIAAFVKNMTQGMQIDLGILVGDLNMAPDMADYQTIINMTKGIDVWRILHPLDSGYTFNSSMPDERLDYGILFQGQATAMEILPFNYSSTITRNGFAPYLSDHRAIHITLQPVSPTSTSQPVSSSRMESSATTYSTCLIFVFIANLLFA
eukprot:TRINITY_DN2919_c0_g2_i1.p1 TRINITY_DN2919_c0_g2~~TRINITY_DN2919_c0_g2_i1.p1  ORF type:complete len:322 (-),score=60.30 TRINITY_DN2919_c0_g2_i1:43-1008(-)